MLAAQANSAMSPPDFPRRILRHATSETGETARAGPCHFAHMERDYVLGTHDEELARLGVQNAIWRPRALDAWRRAGITRGQRVIDFGAGPGYASLDLADVVGLLGEVWAVDRSEKFLAHLQATAKARGLRQVRTARADLERDRPPADAADAAWCRWIFTFLRAPRPALEAL